ncbi:MAG: alcohol dehydrogenase catalytic domain-containing protein [Spirochaetota bacterium]
MKAARLFGTGDVRVVDVDVPSPGPGEVLVRIRAGQVCGTDVRMYKQGAAAASPEHPLTLGHEIAGVVESPGAGVELVASGDRVAVAPNYGCGVCDMCTSGNTQLCPSSEALGVTVDGGFAEYMLVPAPAVRQGNISVLADNVTFQEAALAEPLSCVFNAFERNDPKPGQIVLIIGAGPIGLMHAKLYLMAGAGAVIMNDLLPHRLELCRQIEPAIHTTGPDELEATVRELSDGRGADIVITAAPAPATHQLALELVAVNGTVSYFGGLPRDREIVPINTNLIHYKQIWVTGTTRQSLRQFRTTLSLISKRLVTLDGLMTKSVPLAGIAEVIDDTMNGRGLKNGILIEA